MRILLDDEQVDLKPHGRTEYRETLTRIQTAEGLSRADVAVAWDPATSALTIHKLQIRRGDRVIDVLASQHFTVLRRETDLEAAMMNGALTATLQPDGVRVGDVIDFATSIEERDPALGSHVEAIDGGWDQQTVDLAHLRMQWPARLALRLRATSGLALPTVRRQGGQAGLELSLHDLQRLSPPSDAPSRYSHLRLLETSDFAAWSDLAALLAPLFERSVRLPPKSAVRAEIARIASQSSDPKRRAQAALALVQDRVRYFSLGMDDGGLVPSDADTTWSRRFGDCKGKTVLLLSLLRGLGIEAVPVIVSTTDGDGLDQRLPMAALFDHVLVRASIGNRFYWMDGTRSGDRDLDAIGTPDFRWGLPLIHGATLVPMDRPPPDTADMASSIIVDARAGISLPAGVHAETVLTGDEAVRFHRRLAGLGPDMRTQWLRDFWRQQIPSLQPKSVHADFDPDARIERVAVDGSCALEWHDGWHEFLSLRAGFEADFARDPGPGQDAPFAVTYPSDVQTRETVLLPSTGFTLFHAEPVDRTIAGVAYHRTAMIVGDRFTGEETERSVAREFPASEAAADETALRDLAHQEVFLGQPANAQPTNQARAAAPARRSHEVAGLVAIGSRELDQGRFDDAIAELDKAVAIDPQSVAALATRALAHAWKGETDAAARDVAAAVAIDPRSALADRAKGLLAQRTGDCKGAVAAFTASLGLEPENLFALSHRGVCAFRIQDFRGALADANEVIRREPKLVEAYLLKANSELALGDLADTLRTADDVATADPGNDQAHLVAGAIDARLGRREAALRQDDAALAIRKTAAAFLQRANALAPDDFANRQAAVDRAAALDPSSVGPIEALARLAEDRHDYRGAVAAWSKAVARQPTKSRWRELRSVDEWRSGNRARAEQDDAQVRSVSKRTSELNDLCWMKASGNVSLDAALADCKAALAKDPQDPNTLDSLAFTLFRMGRLDEALSTYDLVLSRAPGLVSSLYGRAVVEAALGQKDRSDLDLAAALGRDPVVGSRFESYGVRVGSPAARPVAKVAAGPS